MARIEAWERPELTVALRAAFSRLGSEDIALAFEHCWARHRMRHKALDNPAGWWAHMLGDACRRLARGALDSQPPDKIPETQDKSKVTGGDEP